MPGELLDFLIIYPYLSPDAIVVLHDVNENHQYFKSSGGYYLNFKKSFELIATSVLFSTVKAVKYYNADAPNIAAFQIDQDTRTHLIDCFFALSHTWAYNMPQNILKIFRKELMQYYDKNCLSFFDQAVRQNRLVKSHLKFGGIKELYFYIEYFRFKGNKRRIPKWCKVLWRKVFSKIYRKYFG
jgi:hypothetical protein